jgi:hypothetical protein
MNKLKQLNKNTFQAVQNFKQLKFLNYIKLIFLIDFFCSSLSFIIFHDEIELIEQEYFSGCSKFQEIGNFQSDQIVSAD